MGNLPRVWVAVLSLSATLLGMHPSQPAVGGPGVQRMSFLGGPAAGTFGIFATGIATYVPRVVPDVEISVGGTSGSVENIRRVQAREGEMGLAFSADLHEAYNGLEAFQGSPQTAIRALGLVFVGVAHLITYRESGIRTVEDLAGKRVAVGNPGSGVFGAAERVFRQIGLWDRITRIPLLGAAAGGALREGRVDAFFFSGPYPDRVTIEAGAGRDVHAVDVYTPLARTPFFRSYPYFTRYDIPAGAYSGVTSLVPTIGIPVLWFAHRDVPGPLMQRIVAAAYSRGGHEHMLRVHSAAGDMTSRKALQGVTFPLHRGAETHWVAVGLEIPDAIRSR